PLNFYYTMKASILVTLSTLVAYAFAANVADRPHLSGKTLNVTANSFCLFMPKTPGETIAASEATAIAFCNNTASAPGAKALPKGFIKSTHFLSGKGEGKYVQYTGSIDNSKYSLDPKDGGGQYDDHGNGKPINSSCIGYPYFVELIEPNDSRYCVRCCEVYADCNAGRSEYGCARIAPGDFS
ncbi:hypothetical protein INT44_001325, partial [Umbelopsis vinacea]